MNFKKTVAIATAVGALTALSIPAMAFENEFHGMYKFMGFQTNFFNGVGANLAEDAGSGFMAEQRARLQYTAKANADLKLVTHFELDARFGGIDNYKGTTGTDAGSLDADTLTLETKNIYLDFNEPLTKTNMKVGLQGWSDSYQSLFLNADMTGVAATKKFDKVTGMLGWFRFDDNAVKATTDVARTTADLLVANAKLAVSKDLTVGASYYIVNDSTRAVAATVAPATATLPARITVPAITKATKFDRLHMVGVDANITAGPVNVKPFAAYQFGDKTATSDIKAVLLGAVTKTKVGPGAVNLSAVYLSGDDTATQEKSFVTVGSSQTYFNAANMWLLVRSGQQINSSNSVLQNDMTAGGKGFMGVFGGYEGTMGKTFYNANVGYAQTAKGTDKGIGTEVNAQIGYKIFDNMSASTAVAYAFLGSAYDAKNYDDPYAVNLQLSYNF